MFLQFTCQLQIPLGPFIDFLDFQFSFLILSLQVGLLKYMGKCFIDFFLARLVRWTIPIEGASPMAVSFATTAAAAWSLVLLAASGGGGGGNGTFLLASSSVLRISSGSGRIGLSCRCASRTWQDLSKDVVLVRTLLFWSCPRRTTALLASW